MKDIIDRKSLYALVEAIDSFDQQEKKLIDDSLLWIQSGKEMFRIQKPNVPPKHWIVYMPIIDLSSNKILLGDHITSGLWLPPGGHVDPWEHPRKTAYRELEEELFIKGDILDKKPFMISSNATLITRKGNAIGKINHEDVGIWYLFKGDSSKKWKFDEREFRSLSWFPLSQVPLDCTEPNMERFLAKLMYKL